ncbi:uncharacterized protein TNCT_194361 [Trichonephila clavata]|uniref:Transposase n=1 Tax=Trichonephila clavata TaxID=2740835 RepID=A0A8X6LTF2_TRICU|nr:uncharacterized protein TNCT_194361 [Trichonephila clavata]
MKAVYGEYSLCRSSVVEWRKRFIDGSKLLEDDARPGQAHRVITQERTAGVNVLVLDYHRITVKEVHQLLVESCLPSEILKAWKSSRFASHPEITGKNDLDS